ncbi:NAD(P)-binding protein [Nemania abortiva]|nr:NAD(P)-binding protein [Nemania abortiva]
MASQRLAGKVAVVTGSSSGLGRAIALAYSGEGAHLVCADLRPEARADVESELSVTTHDQIKKNGGRAIYVQTDVSVSDEVRGLVEKAVEEYGRIDVLVNNAGISLEAGRPPMKIHETLEDMWDTTMAVNVKSVYLASKFTIEQMLKQDLYPSGDRGWIINISSVYGLVGGRAISSYCASKGAVSILTRQVAIDYADVGIHCNAICPGYTRTAIFVNTIKHTDDKELGALHPLHGIGTPQDLVGAAIFLASNESRWVTGVCLPVDGGFTAQ